MWRLPVPSLFAVLATGGLAVAQEPVIEADSIVVTISTNPHPLSVAPGSVTVLDRADIEATLATTLEDLLRGASFVDLSRSGPRGGLTTASLRGGDPNFTLVLLDGVPLNDPTNLHGGSFDFSSLSVDNVERVEIVRGPLSSRLGSEAMGGVIQILSRNGRDDPGWRAEASVGSSGFQEARLGGRGSRGAFDISASGSWISVDEQVERDPYRLWTAAVAAGLEGKVGDLRLVSRFHGVKARGFPENGGGPRFSILRETRRAEARESVLRLEARRVLLPGWSLAAAADLYRRDGDSHTPAILDSDPAGPFSLPTFDQAARFDRRRASVTSAWKLPVGVSFALTGEIRREAGESDARIAGELPADFALERSTRALAGEAAYRSDRLSLDFAVRLDDPEGQASQISPRTGIAWWLPGSRTRMMASWSQGFKLPSFFALGEPNVGNPDLRAERSRGYDFGVAQEIPAARLRLSATLFRQRYRDLIDFSPEQFQLVNRRLVRTRGIEIEGEWRGLPTLAVAAFARWLEAEIVDSDEPLRDRPRWRGGVSAEWAHGPSRVRLEIAGVGDRFDFQIPVPERDVAKGYAVASFAGSRRFERVTAFLRVENLLDADYEEFVGFPAPGRTLRLGLRYAGPANQPSPSTRRTSTSTPSE